MELTFDMNEMMVHVVNVDFGDGAGKVPAHQHVKGGGWVAETAHVDSECYVGPHAVVFGNARVTERAVINDYAKVYGNARVYGHAKVYGSAQIFDNAQVYDNAKVSGHAKVYENAIVVNNALVYDHAEVYGNATVRNNAEVLNHGKILGNADIYDSIKIYDNCIVSRKPIVCFGFESNVLIADHHVALGCVVFPPYFVAKTGKRMMRLMGHSPEISEKWIQALQFVIDFHGCTDRPEDLEHFDERKAIMDLLTAKVGVR
jgi:carbonic anhydrase/acetyltransferase-like protein (isoleucine patch superfamily)